MCMHAGAVTNPPKRRRMHPDSAVKFSAMRNDVDWEKSNGSEEEDDGKSISSESSGGGNPMGNQQQSQSLRCDKDILWDTFEIAMTLKTLPNAEQILEMLTLNHLEELQLIKERDTALLLSVWYNESALDQILSQPVEIDVTDALGRSPLHLACFKGSYITSRTLLQRRANANLWDKAKKATPLHCAAIASSADCICLLIRYGAQVNAGIERKSALHYATQLNAVDCVRTLLKFGADPNTPQVYTETPLHVAAAAGHADCMRLLLDYGADVRSQFGKRRLTALHLAAEDDNVECIKMLMDAGADVNATNSDGQTALHISCLAQAVETTKVLIRRGANITLTYRDGRTALHAAIVKESRCWECARVLLEEGIDVNRADSFGYTPLHIAALNEFSSCVCLLLDYGADITARTNGGVSALSFIVRRTPEVIPTFVERFNSAIKVNDHEIGNVDCEIRIDFRPLVPNTERGETELLLAFVDVGQKRILKHPLCETFLFLKWRRIRKFFLFSLFFHALYVLMFTTYILGVYVKDCPHKPIMALSLSEDMENLCEPAGHVVPVGYVVLILNLILLAKEIFQMAHGFQSYVKYWENWLQWLIILGVFLCSRPHQLVSGDITSVPKWQHHAAAVIIFLVWLELMMLVGRFPIFGLYVQMFTTVAVNFIKFLLAYCCLLVAFSLSFGVLFPDHPAFDSVPWAFLKVIIMMSGELEFEDIFYDEDVFEACKAAVENKDYNMERVQYPVTSHIIFFIFVLLVTIILTNLMVGLAVSDIQGLQMSAGLDRLSRQAELISRLESFLFSKLLKRTPKRILYMCRRNALLRTSRYNLTLTIKPNDPRENRIPKELIAAIYKLVAERRDRNQSMRRRRNWTRNINMFCENITTPTVNKGFGKRVKLRNHPHLRSLRMNTVSESSCDFLRHQWPSEESRIVAGSRPHEGYNELDIVNLQNEIRRISLTQSSIINQLTTITNELNDRK